MKNLIKSAFVFAAGAAAGAVAVMLLPTETGEKMREQVKKLAKETKERVQEYCEQVKNQAAEEE